MTDMANLADLSDRYGDLDGADLVRAMHVAFPGRMVAISSFGAEAAVLLDLVADVDKAIPVIFIDTRELFDETLAYQRDLTAFLGLSDVRIVQPTAADRLAADELWRTDADRCCHLRKVLPMEKAMRGFTVLIDGRKRFHGGERAAIDTIEVTSAGIVKISPLARWDQERVAAAMTRRTLPVHPLVADGYRSIGCWPCSRPSGPDEPIRAGRWAGLAKTECGLHLSGNKRVPAV